MHSPDGPDGAVITDSIGVGIKDGITAGITAGKEAGKAVMSSGKGETIEGGRPGITDTAEFHLGNTAVYSVNDITFIAAEIAITTTMAISIAANAADWRENITDIAGMSIAIAAIGR